jgi:hypothetical protein
VKQKSLHSLDHPQTVRFSETPASYSHPEYFRLPSRGGDPHFGLTRSYYYIGEERGYWKLVRIRERGKCRGLTLVNYNAVAAFVRKQVEGGDETS